MDADTRAGGDRRSIALRPPEALAQRSRGGAQPVRRIAPPSHIQGRVCIQPFTKLVSCNRRRSRGLLVVRRQCATSPRLPCPSLFNSMARASVCTFGILICCFCQVGCVDLGFLAFERGRRDLSKICPEEVLNEPRHDFVLIYGYCLDGNMDDAVKQLAGMDSIGLRVETVVVTYTTLLNGYYKNGRIGEAFAFFREMCSNDFKASSVTYNTMLQGLFQAGRSSAARELYIRMVAD
ncbi:hypothetical protein HU200_022407 [Digitaria exilis]|uniref:Pentatricopeptide repeat-containing protein n=1 Tax=Digitaria exilis TaxID=1010633 RepID=A0A835C7V3_9POAL|nr:hypothetical protein HU200_022407 [Digitaria exilis]